MKTGAAPAGGEESWTPARPETAGGLAALEVQVWRCPLDGPQAAAADLALLDEAERSRAQAFRFPQLRTAFIASHVALRRILAAQLGVHPGELRFQKDRWGKPELMPPHRHLHFNLSHSGAWALVAVTTAGPVGIDVERIAPEPPYEIASLVFSAGETALLGQGHGAAMFYALWCRKEALAKGIGRGFGMDVRTLEVGDVVGDTVARARLPPDAGGGQDWFLLALPPIPGAGSALATTRPDLRLSTFHFDWG